MADQRASERTGGKTLVDQSTQTSREPSPAGSTSSSSSGSSTSSSSGSSTSSSSGSSTTSGSSTSGSYTLSPPPPQEKLSKKPKPGSHSKKKSRNKKRRNRSHSKSPSESEPSKKAARKGSRSRSRNRHKKSPPPKTTAKDRRSRSKYRKTPYPSSKLTKPAKCQEPVNELDSLTSQIRKKPIQTSSQHNDGVISDSPETTPLNVELNNEQRLVSLERSASNEEPILRVEIKSEVRQNPLDERAVPECNVLVTVENEVADDEVEVVIEEGASGIESDIPVEPEESSNDQTLKTENTNQSTDDETRFLPDYDEQVNESENQHPVVAENYLPPDPIEGANVHLGDQDSIEGANVQHIEGANVQPDQPDANPLNAHFVDPQHIQCMFYADSRAKHFDRHKQPANCQIQYNIRTGAKLAELGDIAIYDTQVVAQNITPVILIWGGINDICPKRQLRNWGGSESTFDDTVNIKDIATGIKQSLQDIRPDAVISFGSITPMKIPAYNAFLRSIGAQKFRGNSYTAQREQQTRLEEKLIEINSELKGINHEPLQPLFPRGTRDINLDQLVVKKGVEWRNGVKEKVLKYNYFNLYDGLHGDNDATRFWQDEVIKAAEYLTDVLTGVRVVTPIIENE